MKFFKIRSNDKLKIGLVILFTIIINYFSISTYPIVDNFDKELLQSPWTDNILLNTGSASYLYAGYVFIISGLMYADSLVIDKKTGLANTIFSKMSWRKYISKTVIFNFLIAGIFAIIPLLINILAYFCLRANVPLRYFNTMNIFNDELFAFVFYKSKFLFYLLHLIKVFLVAGIIATFALAINTRFNSRFIGLCIPLIVDAIIQVIMLLFNNSKLLVSVSNIIAFPNKPDYLTFSILIIFLLVSIVYLAREAMKKDMLWIW